MSFSLTLVRGLPGSGKTTFARAMAKNCTITKFVEADQYFYTPAGYKFVASKLIEAHNECRKRAKYFLNYQTSVLVSNTFTQNWEILPYAQMAHAYGADLFIVEMTGQWKSVHAVPDETIARMKARWEPVDWETIKQINLGDVYYEY